MITESVLTLGYSLTGFQVMVVCMVIVVFHDWVDRQDQLPENKRNPYRIPILYGALGGSVIWLIYLIGRLLSVWI